MQKEPELSSFLCRLRLQLKWNQCYCFEGLSMTDVSK